MKFLKISILFKLKSIRDHGNITLGDTLVTDSIRRVNIESVPNFDNDTTEVVEANVDGQGWGQGFGSGHGRFGTRHETTITENMSVNNVEVKSTTVINQGLIAYSVPKDMVVGTRYTVKIRISKEKNERQLIIGDRSIPIGDTNVSVISVEPIRVDPIMSAELLSEKGTFDIDTLSTSVQNIEDRGYTEWEWRIRPLKGGENPLRLIVRVRIKSDQGITYKDIVVFDKMVKIKSNVSFSIKRWFSQYWQWLMSTIVIPFIVWFYKKRKKKKDEEEEE